MFTKHKPHTPFSGAVRLLATLAIIFSLTALVSPATGMAAKATPKVDAGVLKVHVTNYQHGYDVAGAWVYAENPANPVDYRAMTGNDGLATLKLPAGTYLVTVRPGSSVIQYEPWSLYVKVAPETTTLLDARIILSSEMYPSKFMAIDAVTMGPVANAKVHIFDKNGQTIARGVTDEVGLFLIKAPEGTFTADVLHSKYEEHMDFVKIGAQQANFSIVALAPLGEPTLGDMQIHAYDAYTGVPVEGAMVTLYSPKGQVIDQGITDKSGTYYTCLPETKDSVEITAFTYFSYSGGHVTTAGTLTHYKVPLTPFMAR